MQKHPFADVLQNKYSKTFCKIHRKTPLFNKDAGLQPATLLKSEFDTGVFL